jgi:hypothetical protein
VLLLQQGIARFVAPEKLAKRPHGASAHQRRSIAKMRLDCGDERRIARIARRDQHIAQEAVAPGALDRRAGKTRAESGIVEAEQFVKRRVRGGRAGL